MPTLEERIALLEGWKEGQDALIKGIREDINNLKSAITALDQKVDRFREELSDRITALDQKVDSRVDALDQKVDRFREELSDRINTLSGRIDRLFSLFILLLIGVLTNLVVLLVKL